MTSPERPSSLVCEFCGKDPEVINILPIRRGDGSLVTFGCTECAVENGVYCLTHDRPHQGFEDRTTACSLCIEEQVQERGEEIAGNFLTEVAKAQIIPSERLNPLREWSQEVAALTGSTPTLVLARGIVTAAERLKKTPQAITREFIEGRPWIILPWETD